jgi:hypothetical protein
MTNDAEVPSPCPVSTHTGTGSCTIESTLQTGPGQSQITTHEITAAGINLLVGSDETRQ